MAAFKQLGVQHITSLSSSTALTMPTGGARPSHVVISVITQAVRIRMDGSAATSTAGVRVAAGGTFELFDPMGDYTGLIQQMRIIEETASAAVTVNYFTI